MFKMSFFINTNHNKSIWYHSERNKGGPKDFHFGHFWKFHENPENRYYVQYYINEMLNLGQFSKMNQKLKVAYWLFIATLQIGGSNANGGKTDLDDKEILETSLKILKNLNHIFICSGVFPNNFSSDINASLLFIERFLEMYVAKSFNGIPFSVSQR